MAFWETYNTGQSAPAFTPAENIPHASDQYTDAARRHREQQQIVANLAPRITDRAIEQRLRAADADDVKAIVDARRNNKRDPGPKNRERTEREIRDDRREHEIARHMVEACRADTEKALADDADRWLDTLGRHIETKADDIDKLIGKLELSAFKYFPS